jgi:hypothetical protein
VGHAALNPVAAVLGHIPGELFNLPRMFLAKDGKYQGSLVHGEKGE